MGRVCTICSHTQRYKIEELLATWQSTFRGIARTYDVSEDAVSRHVSSRHVSQLISLAADAERAARADTLLDRIEALGHRIEEFLSRVEHTDNYSATLGAFREMRSNLELIGEVTRELDRAGTINLELTVEWQEVKAVLVNTLASYPEAQQAVFNALGEALMGLSEDLKAALCPKPCRRGPITTSQHRLMPSGEVEVSGEPPPAL